ncbi:uncharacterized protein LOC144141398 [Haemaphysalis longicornis]
MYSYSPLGPNTVSINAGTSDIIRHQDLTDFRPEMKMGSLRSCTKRRKLVQLIVRGDSTNLPSAASKKRGGQRRKTRQVVESAPSSRLQKGTDHSDALHLAVAATRYASWLIASLPLVADTCRPL